MIDYLNQVVSFGWPTPIFDNSVGVLDDDGHRVGGAVGGTLLCHPNPFNPTLNIGLKLFANGPVELGVYDVSGRRVKSFPSLAGRQSHYRFTWDGRDDDGGTVGSGIYFVRAKTDRAVISSKVTLLK